MDVQALSTGDVTPGFARKVLKVDGTMVGEIEQHGARWMVVRAGYGVPVPKGLHDSIAAAAHVIVEARSTALSLQTTSSGLLGYQVTVLRLAERYPHPTQTDVLHRAIAEQIPGMSPIQFAQTLNGLIDDPRAALVAPQTVARLGRIRGARRARYGRRAA
jgi:hypothetical protein